VPKFSHVKDVRHNRILQLRKKMLLGWKIPALMAFCTIKLGVSKLTAESYVNEAAEPYRKKYQQQQAAKKVANK